MAEGKEGDEADGGAAQAGPPDASAPRAGHEALPAVESPPLALADPEPEPELQRKLEPKPEPEVAAAAEAIIAERIAESATEESAASSLRAMLTTALRRLHSLPLPSWPRPRLPALPRSQLKPRHRRQAMLATTVLLAAACGAVVGSLIGGNTGTPPSDHDTQAAISRLAGQVATLKADLAAVKVAKTTGAKTGDGKTDGTAGPASTAPLDITGSIPPASAPAPIPPPRPTERIAATVSRPPVVHGWTLRLARNGVVLVEGRGDIYRVVPGAPLPGLGPVREIKRQNGRWVVVTPKGLIVSLRDRRYFE